MTPFKPMLEAAIERAGGIDELDALMPKPSTARALEAVPDDRYLSMISLRVFQAGLKHSMVAAKWPAFEEVFVGFAPAPVAAMHEEQIEALMADKRLIRHLPKLRSVPANAAAILAIAAESGSFGAWLAAWPVTDITGLWAAIGKRFKQMGGTSTPYVLRQAGKDTFILTNDVIKALVGAGVVSRKPTSKRDLAATQAAFNAWASESDRPLCHLSRIAALSVG